MTTREVHTPVITVDVTSTGAVSESVLEKREHTRIALREINNNNIGTTSPEIAIEVSVDGNNWEQLEKVTGTDNDILRNAPEPYVRANVVTASESGTIDIWIAASQ